MDASARALSNRVIFVGDVAIGDGTGTGAMTLGGEVDLAGGTRSITTVVDTTLSGTIGHGGLTKLGTGRLTLTALQAYVIPTRGEQVAITGLLPAVFPSRLG